MKMKMAWSMVLLVAATAVMNIAECWEENPANTAGGVIRVGGKVLCQDCTEGWNEWVDGNKPIEGTHNDRHFIFFHETMRVLVYFYDVFFHSIT